MSSIAGRVESGLVGYAGQFEGRAHRQRNEYHCAASIVLSPDEDEERLAQEQGREQDYHTCQCGNSGHAADQRFEPVRLVGHLRDGEFRQDGPRNQDGELLDALRQLVGKAI